VSGPTGDVLAATRSVTRRFGDFVAVEGVDVEVRAGEVVGLLGANGAGKTTLIRLLLGLLRPSAGEVALFGEPPSRRTRARLGYVPQTLGLYDDLTPEENLAFARAVFGAGGTLPDGLRPSAGVPVGDLPLGVQRRVAFVQALGHRPDLLVLDEPTSGVDPLARARLWESVRTAAEGGAGALVTTHHMDEADECDRLVVMAAGRVVAEGTAAAITGDATVVVVDGDAWADAFAAVDAAGLPAALVGRSLRVPGATTAEVERALAGVPARVREAPATLEERFFELVAEATPAETAETGAGGAGG
jgi:ABC-2 type transport system ATP-binding protein/ribosome-dependent ATPase